MQAPPRPLEIVSLTADWRVPLLAFLSALSPEDRQNFHPHPFTAQALDGIIQNMGRDLYYLLVEGSKVLGYGMLRGWDQGYDVPSLGIALHPAARGSGLSVLLMQFLAAAAQHRGATQVRLRVNLTNLRARRLYESLGYRFASEESGYLVGILQLHLKVDSTREMGAARS